MRWLSGLLIVLASIGLSWKEGGSQAPADPEQVQIENVLVTLSSLGPVVLLQARNRSVPIFVDPTVASSIGGALSGRKYHRPLSHDLMHTIIMAYGGKVAKASITLKDRIYYGELTVSLKGQTKVFDSRSSDAIALAIHFQAPILVGKELLEKAGQEKNEGPDPEQLL